MFLHYLDLIIVARLSPAGGADDPGGGQAGAGGVEGGGEVGGGGGEQEGLERQTVERHQEHLQRTERESENQFEP